jgi:hypothetical protein
MATYNKFNQFTKDLIDGVHQLGTHVLKVALSNTAPSAANATLSAITQITAGNGYSSGGTATTPSTSTASGTAKLTCTDVVFTASGGSIASLRYAVLYNDTPTSPADPLIAWWDYGSSVAPATGETFTVDFDGTNGVFQLA